MPSNVIYARKSTEADDRQILSIESQVKELKELAGRRQIAVAEVLTETCSAKAPGRPVFGALIRRVNKGEIQRVFCWKMDRLARNHLDTGAVLQALADEKIEEVVTIDRTYTQDGNDRFMGSFEFGMATKYIDDLRQNVKRGNRARFQRGWINHIPPLGYLSDPATKTIVKDPERFDLVRRMWDLVLTGTMRPSEIVETANTKWGFRTRRFKRRGGVPLARSTFFEMLANPFFMGEIRLKSGETYAGAHPPMVTPAEFERVQEILGRPGRPRPQRHRFPFAGLIRCGICSCRITGEEHLKPSGRRYVYYRCTRKKRDVPCNERAIPELDLENQVATKLQAISPTEDVHEWLMRHLGQNLAREETVRKAAQETLEKALVDTRREVENLVGLRVREQVTDDIYNRLHKALTEREASLETKLRAPKRNPVEAERLNLKTFTFAKKASHVFLTGTEVQKRMILETVGLNYSLMSRKIRFSLRNPFSFFSESASLSNWSTLPDVVRTWIANTSEYYDVPDLDHHPEG